jgi:sec-independent protein translocase protein TatA
MALLLSPIAFIEGVGGPEMVLILVIVLVLFGGQKLPEFARGLGKSIREFKKAASGVEEEFKRALEEDAQKKYTPPAALPASNPPPELMPGTDYHDEHHIDPHHYSHDSHEAGPSSPVTTETPPSTAVTTPATTVTDPAKFEPAKTEAPKAEAPKVEVPPVSPPPEAKP